MVKFKVLVSPLDYSRDILHSKVKWGFKFQGKRNNGQISGIPYAEPPVGRLRFRNPVFTKGWSGVRDGSEHGSTCPASPLIGIGETRGNEDCLFLNVYTPNIVGSRAVMVYVHGGSFSGGNGDSFIYGPDFFVNEGVLLVTMNYRIGALGFLSTGDSAAQGNYGLKDIVMSLRWVRENIGGFLKILSHG